jgi:hypothetical protein
MGICNIERLRDKCSKVPHVNNNIELCQITNVQISIKTQLGKIMEPLRREDRGDQLNKKRISGDLVDVHFVVDGQKFPAHRLIVALHSPYLRKLSDRNSAFIER